jgi:hypothetical protein
MSNNQFLFDNRGKFPEGWDGTLKILPLIERKVYEPRGREGMCCAGQKLLPKSSDLGIGSD